MKLLVFDNYDSFTWNLVHTVKQFFRGTVDVYRNDEISLKKIGYYDKIILSPGPGLPEEAVMMMKLLNTYASSKSILGVCLGHQAIAVNYGGSLRNLDTVYHGIASMISTRHCYNSSLFSSLPEKFLAGRYHSWVIEEKSLTDELYVTARDQDGTVMAIQHREFDVCGLQFHPESILTPNGSTILQNWINN